MHNKIKSFVSNITWLSPVNPKLGFSGSSLSYYHGTERPKGSPSLLDCYRGVWNKNHKPIQFSHLFIWTKLHDRKLPVSHGTWGQRVRMLRVIANLRASINYRRLGFSSVKIQEWNRHSEGNWDAPGERLKDF